MKIVIFTYYNAITNIGSYLQAYALQTILEEWGHNILFAEKEKLLETIFKCITKINPKRAFFLRLQRCLIYIKASRRFHFINSGRIDKKNIDLLLFGSDEIWNLDNPDFNNLLFFGIGIKTIPKAGYGVSIGEMSQQTIDDNEEIIKGIDDFYIVFARDNRTQLFLEKRFCKKVPLVCDPTLLVNKAVFFKPCKLPKKPYLLVYSYGVEEPLQSLVREYANKYNLKIISAFFWHLWCDTTIECDPLSFGYLINHADCVFTTTFHGAVITMMYHKRCCIYPVRDKVSDVVMRLGASEKLISANISQNDFNKCLNSQFPTAIFEDHLLKSKEQSLKLLRGAVDAGIIKEDIKNENHIR